MVDQFCQVRSFLILRSRPIPQLRSVTSEFQHIAGGRYEAESQDLYPEEVHPSGLFEVFFSPF